MQVDCQTVKRISRAQIRTITLRVDKKLPWSGARKSEKVTNRPVELIEDWLISDDDDLPEIATDELPKYVQTVTGEIGEVITAGTLYYSVKFPDNKSLVGVLKADASPIPEDWAIEGKAKTANVPLLFCYLEHYLAVISGEISKEMWKVRFQLPATNYVGELVDFANAVTCWHQELDLKAFRVFPGAFNPDLSLKRAVLLCEILEELFNRCTGANIPLLMAYLDHWLSVTVNQIAAVASSIRLDLIPPSTLKAFAHFDSALQSWSGSLWFHAMWEYTPKCFELPEESLLKATAYCARLEAAIWDYGRF